MITNEGQDSTITFTVSPPSSKNLGINIGFTGSATPGSDYTLAGQFNRSGQVFILAGQSSVTLTLHSFYDDDPKFRETAIINILGGSGYRIGSPSRTTVTIQNVRQ
jgi:hypothetical protein